MWDWQRIYLGSVPAPSPDGKSFIFEWNDGLWRASTAGGEATPLVTGGDASWPAMSPDGRRVAFGSRRDGSYNVYVLDLVSGACRKVGCHSETTCPRQWTFDGKEILSTGARDDDYTLTCRRALLLDPDGRRVEKGFFDAEAEDPALSPDRSLLLFTWRGEDVYRKRTASTTSMAPEIWSYDRTSGEFACRVRSEYGARNAVWAPDGKSFYYLGGEKGLPFRNVRRYDMATGKSVRLTDFVDEHVFQLAVSADGSTALFRAGFDFWRLDLASPGAKPERIVMHPATHAIAQNPVKRRFYKTAWNNDTPGDIAFTDNGMQIAFTAGGDLWVMETDLREPKCVHGESITHERECYFSPDGKILYYLSDRGDGTDLWAARRADESKAWWENDEFIRTRLTFDNEPRSGFTVSPDGSRLVWMDDSGKMSFADTNGTVIARGPDASGAGSYSWSPDGNWVAVTLGDIYGNFDVWLVPTCPTNLPAYNLSRNFKRDDWPAWSPDGKIVAFIGERAAEKDQTSIFYVYLNPEDEVRDLKRAERRARDKVREYAVSGYETVSEDELPIADEAPPDSRIHYSIDFRDLHKRVRRVDVRAEAPFFRWDSRTLAFDAGNGETHSIEIPTRLEPQRIFRKVGRNARWYQRDSRVAWTVDMLPAHGETTIPFEVYQETNIADYRELGFRTAWARVKNRFYDPALHGADWEAVREKLLPAARNATSASVYSRVMQWMLGELDASHLGFYPSEQSLREWESRTPRQAWQPQTAHLGMRFDYRPANGDGWEVIEILKDGPVEKSRLPIAIGDRLIAIDGRPVTPDADPYELLNGLAGRTVRLKWRVAGRGVVREGRVKSQTWNDARNQRRASLLEVQRNRVHYESGGRLGYIFVPQMDMASFYSFQDDLFAEAYGKEGLVIDVRDNTGGFTADRIIDLICQPDHATFSSRGFGDKRAYLIGYWGKPVFPGKVAVICNDRTFSNGEIFSHAIKNIGRGKLVGWPTGGGVIATNDRPLLDLGNFRDAYRGCYLPDGTDMERHGAVPDILVDLTPADVANGLDPQLSAAVKALL